MGGKRGVWFVIMLCVAALAAVLLGLMLNVFPLLWQLITDSTPRTAMSTMGIAAQVKVMLPTESIGILILVAIATVFRFATDLL
jgi:hypothetical protein